MTYIKTLIFPPVALEQPWRVWCAWRIVAVAVALTMLAAWAHADTPAKLLAELQAAAPGSDAQKKIAQRLCVAERGPLAVALWTSDGALVCRLVASGTCK